MNLMIEEEDFDSNLQDENFAGMKGRAYGEVTTEEVIEHQNHLNEEEKFKLKTVLDKHTVLFDGKLGCYPHEKVSHQSITRYKVVLATTVSDTLSARKSL